MEERTYCFVERNLDAGDERSGYRYVLPSLLLKYYQRIDTNDTRAIWKNLNLCFDRLTDTKKYINAESVFTHDVP